MIDTEEFSQQNEQRDGTSLVLDLTKAILMRWDYAINIITQNNYYELVGNSKGLRPKVTNAVYSLYLTIRNPYCKSRNLTQTELEQKFKVKNFDEIMRLFTDMDLFLYEKKITQFDGKIKYDRTRAELSNIHKQL